MARSEFPLDTCCLRWMQTHGLTVPLLVPQALALSSFLDNNRDRVDMQGKEVLELGAGTGLVTIVASLLGVCSSSSLLTSDTRKNVFTASPPTLSCSCGHARLLFFST